MKKILKRCSALVILAFIPAYGADSRTEFKEWCAPCHGVKGDGQTKLGQNLRVRNLGSADVQKQSDAELAQIIAKGKGKMPRYGTKLKKEEIDSLVKYIRSLKK